MTTYRIHVNFASYVELANMYRYIHRLSVAGYLGKAYGSVYTKLVDDPDFSDYANREMEKVAEYYNPWMKRVKERFQREMYNVLVRKPPDFTDIRLQSYTSPIVVGSQSVAIVVDYHDGEVNTILIDEHNIKDYFNFAVVFKQNDNMSYSESESMTYHMFEDDYYNIKNPFPGVSKYDTDFTGGSCRNFTFQVTEDCNLRCSYCYQTNKKATIMDLDTAKSAIDDLLAGRFEYLSPGFSKSIILEFIGGDPLLEIDLIGDIYEYFLQEAYRLNHPWFYHHRLSMCSNGLLYFNESTRRFFDRFAKQVSFNVSIDGNKALHDSCRIQPTGEGSYDVGIAAVHHANEVYNIEISSKMTLAPSNIPMIMESVKNLCIDNHYPGINLNVVFEDVWSQHDARVLYDQLIGVADMVMKYDRPDLYFSIFRKSPLTNRYDIEDLSDNMSNICGGVGSMLALDPHGTYYPCIRYMPSSLNHEVKELVIGNINDKLTTVDDSDILKEFLLVTFMSQQNDRCLSCRLTNMCGWCSGLCYQEHGTVNEASRNICEMIKAEYLAAIYYWGNLHIRYPQYGIPVERELMPYSYFENIITKDEWDMLSKYTARGGIDHLKITHSERK